MERGKTLAFAGHRSKSLPFGDEEQSAGAIRLKALLLTEIMDRVAQGYDTFFCGAARGSGLIYGRLVLLVKETECPSSG